LREKIDQKICLWGKSRKNEPGHNQIGWYAGGGRHLCIAKSNIKLTANKKAPTKKRVREGEPIQK